MTSSMSMPIQTFFGPGAHGSTFGRRLAEAGEVLGDVAGDAAHDDTPARPRAVVDHVGLEDDGLVDDGVDLRAGVGAEHDRVLEGGVVDDADDRLRRRR